MNDLLSGVLNSNEQLIGLVLTVLAVVFIVSIIALCFSSFHAGNGDWVSDGCFPWIYTSLK